MLGLARRETMSVPSNRRPTAPVFCAWEKDHVRPASEAIGLVEPFGSAAVIAVAALIVYPASADPPGQQIEDFYYPDGTQVLSDGGMPHIYAAPSGSPTNRPAGSCGKS